MPVGFNIGPLFVHFYGMILMSGAVAGAWLAHYRARKKELDTEFVWDSLTWVLIGGIIGARLWHIFTPPPSMVAQGITVKYYLTHPLDALAIWRGVSAANFSTPESPAATGDIRTTSIAR